jgi:hypothetical protein
MQFDVEPTIGAVAFSSALRQDAPAAPSGLSKSGANPASAADAGSAKSTTGHHTGSTEAAGTAEAATPAAAKTPAPSGASRIGLIAEKQRQQKRGRHQHQEPTHETLPESRA